MLVGSRSITSSVTSNVPSPFGTADSRMPGAVRPGPSDIGGATTGPAPPSLDSGPGLGAVGAPARSGEQAVGPIASATAASAVPASDRDLDMRHRPQKDPATSSGGWIEFRIRYAGISLVRQFRRAFPKGRGKMRGQTVSGQSRTVNGSLGGIKTMIPRRRGPHYRRVISLALAVIVAAVGGLVAAPAYAAGNGSVYFVQGLPGQTVDLVVDGETVAKGVKATKVVGPLELAAGSRRISARAGGKVLVERQVTVGANSNSDVVVHRPASPTAAPVITTYANKLTA